ncbi:hypothetical protein B0H13DRAFT_2300793 [Mycena leptocephala]|nr:hypothetical protein B0H13DRAFT_2300793 [Mycena leptocephala]
MSQNLIEPLSNLSLVVGLVLSIYDHLLTLAPEIRLYWRPPRPWFLLIRYLNLAGNIIMAVLTFGNFGPESGMNTCVPVHTWNRAKSADIIYAILTLRVYVVFNRDWRILVLLSLSGLGSLAVGAWLRATANGGALPESLCILSNASGTRIAGAWEAGLLCDVLIFALTLQRGISHWRHENYRSPVLRLLLFLVRMILNTELRTLSKEWNSAIALVDLADILVYYFGDAALYGWQATILTSMAIPLSLSVVLTIRLMLNMREVIDTGTAGSEGDDVTSVEWNIVDLQKSRERHRDVLERLKSAFPLRHKPRYGVSHADINTQLQFRDTPAAVNNSLVANLVNGHNGAVAQLQEMAVPVDTATQITTIHRNLASLMATLGEFKNTLQRLMARTAPVRTTPTAPIVSIPVASMLSTQVAPIVATPIAPIVTALAALLATPGTRHRAPDRDDEHAGLHRMAASLSAKHAREEDDVDTGRSADLLPSSSREGHGFGSTRWVFGSGRARGAEASIMLGTALPTTPEQPVNPRVRVRVFPPRFFVRQVRF